MLLCVDAEETLGSINVERRFQRDMGVLRIEFQEGKRNRKIQRER